MSVLFSEALTLRGESIFADNSAFDGGGKHWWYNITAPLLSTMCCVVFFLRHASFSSESTSAPLARNLELTRCLPDRILCCCSPPDFVLELVAYKFVTFCTHLYMITSAKLACYKQRA